MKKTLESHIPFVVNWNDQFIKKSGEDAIEKYKKQTAESKRMHLINDKKNGGKANKHKDEDDEDDYYDSMDYGDEFNDQEE